MTLDQVIYAIAAALVALLVADVRHAIAELSKKVDRNHEDHIKLASYVHEVRHTCQRRQTDEPPHAEPRSQH